MISYANRPTVVVAGTGMAGAKVVEEILQRAPDRFQIRMFGAEPHGTYNRILLSTYLGGFSEGNGLWLNPLEWYEQHNVYVHAGVDPKQPLDDQDEATLLTKRYAPDDSTGHGHRHVVHGHHPFRDVALAR